MKQYICLDIGGTFIKHGIIDEEGNFLQKGAVETESEKGAQAILKKVDGIIREYLSGHDAEGICLSTAGIVDSGAGTIIHANANIPNYTGTNLKGHFEEKYGIPCEVENDVNCAGLAEAVSGAAVGKKIVFCLTVGTGIGGCLLVDGNIFHGGANCACEVGYMRSANGSFEPEGTVSTLVAEAARRKGEPAFRWNGRRVLGEAKRGDKVCMDVLEYMTKILGAGIANICYVVNPEIVVLGGGIMGREYEDLLYPRIRSAMDSHLIPIIARHTELKMAVHRNDAGMLGAFYHFRKCRENAGRKNGK
ncbi:MAG: ROK family protein [Lachnospiraceae bacterium]|nr:ROK family protein [Lachnospiraceae bacterium]